MPVCNTYSREAMTRKANCYNKKKKKKKNKKRGWVFLDSKGYRPAVKKRQ